MQGTYAKVKYGQHCQTEEPVAIKVNPKACGFSARTPFANGSLTHRADDAAYSCLGTSRIAVPADRAATRVRLLL